MKHPARSGTRTYIRVQKRKKEGSMKQGFGFSSPVLYDAIQTSKRDICRSTAECRQAHSYFALLSRCGRGNRSKAMEAQDFGECKVPLILVCHAGRVCTSDPSFFRSRQMSMRHLHTLQVVNHLVCFSQRTIQETCALAIPGLNGRRFWGKSSRYTRHVIYRR